MELFWKWRESIHSGIVYPEIIKIAIEIFKAFAVFLDRLLSEAYIAVLILSNPKILKPI